MFQPHEKQRLRMSSLITSLTSGPLVSTNTRIPAMIPAEQTAEMMAVTRIRVQPGHFSSGDTVILIPRRH